MAIAASDSIMNNLLLKNVAKYAQNINPHTVLEIGAYGIRDKFDAETLRGVRQAWMVGLRGAWAMVIALFGMAFLSSFLAKWPGSLAPPESSAEVKAQESEGGNEIQNDLQDGV